MSLFDFFLPKQRTIKCPDGSPRVIYRNIDDVCPFSIKDFNAEFESTVKGMKQLEAKTKGKYKKHVHGMLYQLNSQNESLMLNFRMIYAGAQHDPCANGDFLKREIQKLVDEQQRMSRLHAYVTSIVLLISASPQSAAQLTEIFSKLAMILGGSAVAPAAELEIVEARKEAQAVIEDGKKEIAEEKTEEEK